MSGVRTPGPFLFQSRIRRLIVPLGRQRRRSVGWLPGTDVTALQPELIARLEERRSRPGYSPREAKNYSQEVGLDFLGSEFFAAEKFLVYVERFDCPRLNRLYLIPHKELVDLLRAYTRPELGEGLDLTITTFAMAEFVLTNHDGAMSYRRPSEWPAAEERG